MEITSYKVTSSGRIVVTTENECSLYLDSSDIMKWLDAQEPVILDRIARYAFAKWREKLGTSTNDDDSHS